MALFYSISKPSYFSPKSRRNYEIQTPISSVISISNNPSFRISKISISSSAKPINTFFQRAKCSSYADELDRGSQSNVIIFIKGLAQSTSEGGLKEAFSQFGEVSRVKVVCDKETKRSLGFAYVRFKNVEHAQAAVEEMNGKFFEGRFIYVTIAKPGSRKPRPRPSPYKF